MCPFSFLQWVPFERRTGKTAIVSVCAKACSAAVWFSGLRLRRQIAWASSDYAINFIGSPGLLSLIQTGLDAADANFGAAIRQTDVDQALWVQILC